MWEPEPISDERAIVDRPSCLWNDLNPEMNGFVYQKTLIRSLIR